MLEFIDRADQQLKIRGFRVEPGEIQAVLLRYPAVVQGAVVPREDPGDEKRTGSYIVAQTGERVDPALLRTYLAQSLPGYIVPRAIVMLDPQPLSPSGKLDRKALPALEFRASGSAASRSQNASGRDPLCTLPRA